MPVAQRAEQRARKVRRPDEGPVPGEVLNRPSRGEQVERIEALAGKGYTASEIAAQVGLAASTVRKYRRDPDGEQERTRREGYRRTCRGCGRLTRANDGPGRGPEFCAGCAPLQRRRWSDEQLLEAIRDWTGLTGAPPALADWSPGHARVDHGGAARYRAEPGRWPNASTVARRFGTLRAAIEHAGLASGKRRR